MNTRCQSDKKKWYNLMDSHCGWPLCRLLSFFYLTTPGKRGRAPDGTVRCCVF